MVTIISSTLYVLFMMDYANVIHEFCRNYLLTLPKNQVSSVIILAFFQFFTQPIFVTPTNSVPLLFVLLVVVAVVVYVVSKLYRRT